MIRSWKTEVGHTQEKPWIVLRIAWHAEYALLRTMSHHQMIEALSLRSIFSSSLMEALSSQGFPHWTCSFQRGFLWTSVFWKVNSCVQRVKCWARTLTFIGVRETLKSVGELKSSTKWRIGDICFDFSFWVFSCCSALC